MPFNSKTRQVFTSSDDKKSGVQPHSQGKHLMDCRDDIDGQNRTFPGPLTCNTMHKDDLIQFIRRKCEDCLLHAGEPEQRESFFFWKIMELFCSLKKKAKLPQVAVVLFRAYKHLRKNIQPESVQEQNWCLQLADLLCSSMADDEHVKAVIDMGDSFATKGLTFAAHLCYVVVYKESDFGLIGYQSFPNELSAMKEAIERTEVYEHVLGQNSGFTRTNLQEYKVLYALKLYESGLLSEALEYCENITKAVIAFPDRIPSTLLNQLIQLSVNPNKGKEKEPEWLLNLRMLQSDDCTEQQQPTENLSPVILPTNPEYYLSRVQEFKAFKFLTEELTSQYTIGELIGYGGEGAVFAGVRISDGREVAIKFSILDDYCGMLTIPGEKSKVPVEVGLLQMVSKPVRCPYILELLEWFKIPNYTVMILERPSPCMDLTKFCKLYDGKLPEPLVRDIMFQLIQAVRHCFNSGVIHNDIKPGNILISTQTLQIKLIDFGAGCLAQKTPFTFCPGTLEYSPPEWFKHKEYLGGPATIWSLGIVMYQLLYGDLPFESSKEITAAELHFPPGVSENGCNLISWCLHPKPEYRPDLTQILKHKWMMSKPSYYQSIPIIGGLISRLVNFLDYYMG